MLLGLRPGTQTAARELELLQFADYYIDRRDPRRPRFCKHCKSWKPERTHHCSVMGRCVLKMVGGGSAAAKSVGLGWKCFGGCSRSWCGVAWCSLNTFATAEAVLSLLAELCVSALLLPAAGVLLDQDHYCIWVSAVWPCSLSSRQQQSHGSQAVHPYPCMLLVRWQWRIARACSCNAHVPPPTKATNRWLLPCCCAGCELCGVGELQVFPAVPAVHLCGHPCGHRLLDTAHAGILLRHPSCKRPVRTRTQLWGLHSRMC